MPVVKYLGFDRCQSSECVIKFCWDLMVWCGRSSPGLQLLSQLEPRVEGCSRTIPYAPCYVDQLSLQFCRVSLSLFSLRGTCGDPAVVLSTLQSVLSVATASWLKLKESIISLQEGCEILGFVRHEHLRKHLPRMLSLINNESEWDRRRSDTVGPCVVQISVDLWHALLVCAIFGRSG